MVEVLETLTPRLQRQAEELLQQQQRQTRWHGDLPVLLLDRCWLQLRRIAVAELAQVLPPDSSADAPELVRFRDLRQQGVPHLEAQQSCWQEFGRQSCTEALHRFWQAQERGNRGWTLSAYLDLLERYRQLVLTEGPTPVPILVLGRHDSGDHHRLQWCWP